jgi:hypothetical protein
MNKTLLMGAFAFAALAGGCLINIEYYYAHYLLVSFLTAIVTGFLILLTLESYREAKEDGLIVNSTDANSTDANKAIALITGIFVLAIVIIINNYREEKAFKDSGIEVIGKVTNGVQETSKGRRNSTVKTYKLNIAYNTLEGLPQSIEKEVDAEEFENVFLNMPVNLIYNKNSPTMVKLLIKSKEILKYKNIEDRKLTVLDIIKIDSLKSDSLQILKTLNKIALDWRSNFSEGNQIYLNERKQEILFFKQNTLCYLYYKKINDSSSPNYLEFLKPLGVLSEKNIPIGEIIKTEDKPKQTPQQRVNEILQKSFEGSDKSLIIDTKKYNVAYELKSETNNETHSVETKVIYIFAKK